LQAFELGTQLPEQAPPLHSLSQAGAATHSPAALHVEGTSPSHFLVSGAQFPAHLPAKQAWLRHA
jgi:hypothetical protein